MHICMRRALAPRSSRSRGLPPARPRPAGELGNCNDKLVANRLEICFQERVVLCGFFSTSVRAPSKDSELSVSIYHASKELKVQLIGGQQSINTCFVRCRGTR